MFPDDLTTAVLAQAMAGYNARNTAIANNIANAETPGYKRVDVSFEAALADAVEADRDRLRRDPGAGISAIDGSDVTRAVDEVAAAVRSLDTTTMRVDGSNVDPDDEMARLSANQLASTTVVSLLDKRFAQFRTAITGR
jgi:flagellar basal-body rod protein FlgB